MGRDWLKVLIAAFFEIMWVVGLKYADSIIEWSLTVIGMIGSFYLLILAGRNLPIGTVYAVFVGIGTAGTVLLDFIIFNEPFSLAKVLLIGLMLAGIIGLKLVEDEEGKAVE
ncbi:MULTISPECIES: multidrug efflux SMR transporter [Allobacillus]|uniref:Multidrug efflux SMR transporter n=1 Tax=Allobacillus salarius TaxID=1955272 RepID=A0A556PPC5_9BACI|nr:multidrug efflux SMR transporter [Allobacillus salarius]TSJ66236.1 multidrug efflux SMR transporter [Allobacillus salarius]